MKIIRQINLKKLSLVATSCFVCLVLMGSKRLLHRTTTLTALRKGSDAVHLKQKLREEVQTKKSGFGYVLVNQFFDQMTGASYSILSLQCWAGAVSQRLKIVEPFVYPKSSFGISLKTNILSEKSKEAGEDSNNVRLRDVLNLDSWEEQVRGHGYAPFESWKAFQKSAPRNLIIVSMACKSNEKNDCNDRFYQIIYLFADKHGFKIVRSVHVENKLHSFGEFQNLIYGDNDPEEAVVLFNHWGGILSHVEDHRIAISNIDRCTRGSFSNFLFDSSHNVAEDSKRYLDRYMLKDESNYISVMLRTERFGISHKFKEMKSQEEKLLLFTRCVKEIVHEVHTMQTLHKTTGVFFTVDCRRYGSRGFSSSAYHMSKDLLDTVVEMLFLELKNYGMRLSLQEWDDSFDEVSSFQTPGYVALLQKNLAASGRCLVTAGGGSFQKSAQTLYNSFHNGNTTRECYEEILEC